MGACNCINNNTMINKEMEMDNHKVKEISKLNCPNFYITLP